MVIVSERNAKCSMSLFSAKTGKQENTVYFKNGDETNLLNLLNFLSPISYLHMYLCVTPQPACPRVRQSQWPQIIIMEKRANLGAVDRYGEFDSSYQKSDKQEVFHQAIRPSSCSVVVDVIALVNGSSKQQVLKCSCNIRLSEIKSLWHKLKISPPDLRFGILHCFPFFYLKNVLSFISTSQKITKSKCRLVVCCDAAW